MTSADINCNNDRLFAGTGGTRSRSGFQHRRQWRSGAHSRLAVQRRIRLSVSASQVALLSPNDLLLFVSNQESISVTVFTVAPGGSLTPVAGSPFPALSFPSGMVTDPTGSFLYVAGLRNNGVDVASVGVLGYSVAPSGSLTPVGFFPTGGFWFPLSMAVYPAKSCGTAMCTPQPLLRWPRLPASTAIR